MLKAKIEQAARAILDARALYPDSSLADHDQLTMPSEMYKVHQNNDRAVMQAYSLSVKDVTACCLAEIMKLYQAMVTKQKIYVVKVRRFTSKKPGTKVKFFVASVSGKFFFQKYVVAQSSKNVIVTRPFFRWFPSTFHEPEG